MNKKIGQLFKKQRLYLNLITQDIADCIGISRVTLTQIENGNVSPSIKVYINLCNLYKLDPNCLINPTLTYSKIIKNNKKRNIVILKRRLVDLQERLK